MSDRGPGTPGNTMNPGPPPGGRGIRILLVEDHLDTARIFAQVLCAAGHTVTTARTLAEARAQCAAGSLDLLLVDIILPDGLGWDLLPLPPDCAIPAIAMTGLAMPADLERSRLSGFAEHLIKPFHSDTVLAAIRRVHTAATARTRP
jgi:two-component system, chemotaxis family, CheB/CheR fusion protein